MSRISVTVVAAVTIMASAPASLAYSIEALAWADTGVNVPDSAPGVPFEIDYAQLVGHDFSVADLVTVALSFNTGGAAFEHVNIQFQAPTSPVTLPAGGNGFQAVGLLYDPAYGVPTVDPPDIPLIEMEAALKQQFLDGVLDGALWLDGGQTGPRNWRLAATVEYAYPDAGDVDGSGQVDDGDLSIVLSNWQQSAGWAKGDLNGDLTVGDEDLSLLLANWDGALPSGGAVPEPMTLALIALGGLSVIRRKR